jgi:N-acetylmuramoyl-L-alanine amidase
MIIEKLISAVLVSTIFIESSVVGPVFAKEAQSMHTEEPQPAPVVEMVEIEEEVTMEIVEEPTPEPEIKLEPKPEPIPTPEPEVDTLPLTDEEIDLIALVTMAEAEGESELGKRLVIDVILNRWESKRFPDTIKGVIYARNQFECMTNGRVDRCHVKDDIRELVIEELQSRTQSNIHYFRNMAIGAILGFVVICAVLLAFYIFDDKIKTPDDIEKHLGLSVLGEIPEIEEEA